MKNRRKILRSSRHLLPNQVLNKKKYIWIRKSCRLLHTCGMKYFSPIWRENNPFLHKINYLKLEIYESVIGFYKCTLSECWLTEIMDEEARLVLKTFDSETWPAIQDPYAHLYTNVWIYRSNEQMNNLEGKLWLYKGLHVSFAAKFFTFFFCLCFHSAVSLIF